MIMIDKKQVQVLLLQLVQKSTLVNLFARVAVLYLCFPLGNFFRLPSKCAPQDAALVAYA